ncbi:MAG: Rid family hydrolase [Pseudomonadota bacterium]|nr:Rid family hydrolase [Pseudomonadota bacterium]
MDWRITHHMNYWGGIKLAYPDVPKEQPRFAKCVVVGNLVFVSGCGGGDPASDAPAPENITAQVNQALDLARSALETAGSSMNNIIKTYFLITSLDDYGEVRKTETEYYEVHAPALVEKPPAATLMVVPALARPEYKLEYEVIGVIERSAPDWSVTYFPEFWGGKELAFPHVPREHAKFARTQVAGNLVIVSGCQALDHDTIRTETDDIAEQSEIVLEKIRNGMEETGGDLSSLAKTNVFVKDAEALDVYRRIERAYFEKYSPEAAAHPPASTAFIVAELPRPEFLIEVEAFGVIDKNALDFAHVHRAGTEFAAESVTTGRLVFLSGCEADEVSTGPLDVEVAAVLEKVRAALTNAGSSMNNIVKLERILKLGEDNGVVRDAEFEFYQKYAPRLLSHPPASMFSQLSTISAGSARYQIDVTAVI